MLMEPLLPADRARLTPRLARRRRLRIMLAVSVLVHVLALLAIWLLRPQPTTEGEPTEANQVAVVYESAAGQQESTRSDAPQRTASLNTGNPLSDRTQPSPDTTPPPAAPPPAPAPPQEDTPPPLQQASVEAPTPPADPAPPPAATVAPDPTPAPAELPQAPPQPEPRPPATVSLSENEMVYPPQPQFVMPQAPAPLPPLPVPPRPAPPRRVARPVPQNPFAMPQDFSFNAAPTPQSNSRSARGFDLAPTPQGGQSNSSYAYVAGARPTGDWLGAFRRWAQARVYYPEEAAREGQDGVAVVMLEIERSGHVRSVQLVSSARSPFLDGALVDVFRNANVPPVTSDMPGDTTTMQVRLTYHLIRH